MPVVLDLEHHRVGNMRLLYSDFGTGMLLDSVHPAFGPSALYQTQEAFERSHAIFGSTKFEDIQETPDTKRSEEILKCPDAKEKVNEVPDAEEEICRVPDAKEEICRVSDDKEEICKLPDA